MDISMNKLNDDCLLYILYKMDYDTLVNFFMTNKQYLTIAFEGQFWQQKAQQQLGIDPKIFKERQQKVHEHIKSDKDLLSDKIFLWYYMNHESIYFSVHGRDCIPSRNEYIKRAAEYGRDDIVDREISGGFDDWDFLITVYARYCKKLDRLLKFLEMLLEEFPQDTSEVWESIFIEAISDIKHEGDIQFFHDVVKSGLYVLQPLNLVKTFDWDNVVDSAIINNTSLMPVFHVLSCVPDPKGPTGTGQDLNGTTGPGPERPNGTGGLNWQNHITTVAMHTGLGHEDYKKFMEKIPPDYEVDMVLVLKYLLAGGKFESFMLEKDTIEDKDEDFWINMIEGIMMCDLSVSLEIYKKIFAMIPAEHQNILETAILAIEYGNIVILKYLLETHVMTRIDIKMFILLAMTFEEVCRRYLSIEFFYDNYTNVFNSTLDQNLFDCILRFKSKLFEEVTNAVSTKCVVPWRVCAGHCRNIMNNHLVVVEKDFDELGKIYRYILYKIKYNP